MSDHQPNHDHANTTVYRRKFIYNLETQRTGGISNASDKWQKMVQ
jgi:hypothetical protein